MPHRDQILEDLAAAVLDGADVDWAAAEKSADAAGLPLVRDLRLLASVAQLHRDVLTNASPFSSDRWGHLRLLERVGAGTSGEVFRAWDERLDREVALKLLPADPAPDHPPSSVIREGQLLAKVRHPNVVTIHGAEQIGDRIGLWMEFVRGRTLEQLLQPGAQFQAAEVIDIGVELGRAVSAVHAAGLLHRDIKAHNVMRADDGRIVLMDFGTVRELDDGTAFDIAGTPLYLAPELFQAKPATVQTDVYSLGVLLYRLATGSYPVRGSSAAELRTSHERGVRVTARQAMQNGAGLARVIDQAIDPRPGRRTQSAAALGAALLKLQRHERRKPVLYRVGLGAGVLVIGFTAWVLRTPPSTPSPPPTSSVPQASALPASPAPPQTTSVAGGERGTPFHEAPDTPVAGVGPLRVRPPGVRPSVQVLPLANASGRIADGWLSGTIAEMLLREFRGSESFRWIPGAMPLAKAQLGHAMRSASSMSIRPVVPADVVISGEYSVSGPPSGPDLGLRLTVRLDDKVGGRTTTLSETGTTTDLVGLMSRIGAQARAALGTPPLTENQAKGLLASQPANAAAARAYADGFAKLPAEAVESLEQAVAADPRFAPAFIRLAEGWYFRGGIYRGPASPEAPERRNAVAAAEKALQLSTDLPREERMLIEIRATSIIRGSSTSTDGDEIYRRLFSLFPDTLLYGFETAQAYSRTQRMQEALATLDLLSPVPGASEDLGLLQLEASVARSARDYQRARRALDQAEKLATGISDQALLGRIRADQAQVARDLGDAAKALAYAEEAVRIFTATGSRLGIERVRGTLALAYRETGDVTRARATFEQLIETARDAGNRPQEWSWRRSVAGMLLSQGKLSEARVMFEQVIQESRADPKAIVFGVEEVGEILRRQGQLSAAQKHLQEMVVIARRPGFYEGFELPVQARLHFDQGDLTAAREVAARGEVFGVLARTLLALGETAAARQAIDEARRLPPAPTSFRSADIDVALVRALLECDEGRFADCRTAAQEASALARGDFRPDDAAEAEGALAVAWLKEGNLLEAQRAIARADQRLQVTEDRLLRLTGGIAAARVQAATKVAANVSSAQQRLETLIQEASDLGAVALALDARLALGEIDMIAGDRADGRARLAALERDALAKGFVAVARRAAAASR